MITAQTIKVTDLSSHEKLLMYELFEQYYSSVTLERFHSDLESKHYSILLRSDDNKIQGFTTLEVVPISDNPKEGIALYSGDTILHHDYWGDQTLPWAWCRLAGNFKAKSPETPLYWFLIVKGHRTYRYLPVFTRQFYPNHKVATPNEMQFRMDQLARKKFGDAYKRDNGIVHFEHSKGHLNESFKTVAPHLEKNPHVLFFLERNKHYDKGNELVCITELCESNMRFHAKKAFLEGLQYNNPIVTFVT